MILPWQNVRGTTRIIQRGLSPSHTEKAKPLRLSLPWGRGRVGLRNRMSNSCKLSAILSGRKHSDVEKTKPLAQPAEIIGDALVKGRHWIASDAWCGKSRVFSAIESSRGVRLPMSIIGTEGSGESFHSEALRCRTYSLLHNTNALSVGEPRPEFIKLNPHASEDS